MYHSHEESWVEVFSSRNNRATAVKKKVSDNGRKHQINTRVASNSVVMHTGIAVILPCYQG